VVGGHLSDPPLWASPCAGPASKCVPKFLTRPAGQAPRRRGLAGPFAFKGTLLVLRKRNFVVSAALRLSSDHPVYKTPCVLYTEAGPSVVRAAVLPPGWKQQARRAPRSTHMCDASGQLLKVKSQVGLSFFEEGASTPLQFLVVTSLSVPVILGMDVQKEHVKAIYPGFETVAWNHGGLTRAENAWDGKKKEPNPVKGNPTRRDKGAIYLRQGVTVAPRTVQAVSVVCGTAGLCRLVERPEVLAKKGLRLQNALAILKPRRELILHLTNISDRQVNLPKIYAIGLAEPCAGPTYEITEEDCSTAGARQRRWRVRQSTGGAVEAKGGRRRGPGRARTERGQRARLWAQARAREGARLTWTSPRGPSGRGRRARQATAHRARRGGCSALRAERSLPLVCNDRIGGLCMHGGNYLHWLVTARVKSLSGNWARGTVSDLLGRRATTVGGTVVAGK